MQNTTEGDGAQRQPTLSLSTWVIIFRVGLVLFAVCVGTPSVIAAFGHERDRIMLLFVAGQLVGGFGALIAWNAIHGGLDRSLRDARQLPPDARFARLAALRRYTGNNRTRREAINAEMIALLEHGPDAVAVAHGSDTPSLLAGLTAVPPVGGLRSDSVLAIRILDRLAVDGAWQAIPTIRGFMALSRAADTHAAAERALRALEEKTPPEGPMRLLQPADPEPDAGRTLLRSAGSSPGGDPQARLPTATDAEPEPGRTTPL